MVLRGQNAPSTLVIGKPKGYKPDVIMTIEDKVRICFIKNNKSKKEAIIIKHNIILLYQRIF